MYNRARSKKQKTFNKELEALQFFFVIFNYLQAKPILLILLFFFKKYLILLCRILSLVKLMFDIAQIRFIMISRTPEVGGLHGERTPGFDGSGSVGFSLYTVQVRNKGEGLKFRALKG